MRLGWFGLLVGIIALIYGGLWWYGREIHPLSYGVSFSSGHAEWMFGSQWKNIYQEMLDELKPPFIRLSVDWNAVEKKEGVYDFSSVDFMMNQAATYGSKVLLSFGQKTPRWPECHTPDWALQKTDDDYTQKLYAYVSTTINRYKKHSALEYWQVENEAYIKFSFGQCEKFNKNAIDEELRITRNLDPDHAIVVTDSGELSLWYPAAKKGDIFGTTMYRVVAASNGSVVSYDWLPLGWYRARAKFFGLTRDQFFISELQAEPWIDGNITSTSLETQFKTMDITRMKKNLLEAEHAGASRAYLWGVEWWYWLKHEKNDHSFVDVAKEFIGRGN